MRRFSYSLGDVESAKTRSMMCRSAALVAADLAAGGIIAAGTADGGVVAFDAESIRRSLPDSERPAPQWTATGEGSVVSLTAFAGGVVAGERGHRGTVRLLDAGDGAVRWRYDASDDIGCPQRPSRNYHPTVAAARTDGERLYLAVRRQFLRDGRRAYESAVVALDAAGEVVWRRRFAASPSGADVRDDRLAVGFTRPADESTPTVVVFDGRTGDAQMEWCSGSGDGRRDDDGNGVGSDGDGVGSDGDDVGNDGDARDRKVGDVALLPDGVAVTSYDDRRGYVLRGDGRVRWRADLGRPTAVRGATVFAHPTRVRADGDRVAFFTGSTFPRERHDSSRAHPDEYTVRCYGLDGALHWRAPVGGLVRDVADRNGRLLVPSAQNVREPDATAHAVRRFDLRSGEERRVGLDGIPTAVALGENLFAAVEEPIRYHNEAAVRGEYALRVGFAPLAGGAATARDSVTHEGC